MEQIIKKLDAIIIEYAIKFSSLSDEELSFKPDGGKWSKKEIIGHLVDSAQNNTRRFITAQYQSTVPVFYNQNDWVIIQNYQNYDNKNLIMLWQLLNKHIAVILKNIPVQKYQQLCNTGKEQDEFYTIEFLAKDYIAHHLHHLKQIAE